MDLGKLMSMWEESKREVEESRNENAEAEISKSHFLNENSDDVNQEMQHLKQRIKQYKYREDYDRRSALVSNSFNCREVTNFN